jgi:hypothetical protein
VFGGRKKNVTVTSVENTLYISVSASGYRIRSPGQRGDTRGEVPAGTGLERIEQLEKALADAAGNIADGAAKKVEAVSLLIDSPLVVMRDRRDPALASVSDARAREVGAQLLGSRESSFGKTRFATAGAKRGSQDVYAFIDLNSLKRLLASMDQLAVKVREIVPLPYLLMRRALATGEGVYGAISVGGEDTTVCFAQSGTSTVVTRHLPIGIDTIVRAVASAQSVSQKEAMTGLTRRNYFEDLPKSAKDERSGVSLGAVEAALAEPVRALVREIRDSIEFLNVQLGIESPPIIELLGDAEKLPGFDDWLREAIEPERVDPGLGDLYEDFVSMERDTAINLLSGSAGGLFSTGKLTYEYRNNQFVVAEANSSGGSNVPRALQSRAASRRRGRSKAGGLFSFGRSNDSGTRSTRGGQDDETLYRAGVGLMVLAVLYFGFGEVESKSKLHTGRYGTYLTTVASLNTEAGRAGVVGGAGTGPVQRVSDKVFWGEKFLAIGDHINNHLWLTDVFVTRGGSARSSGQRLVIKGAALPSHQGHIQRISCFVRALTNDHPDGRPGFISDFREIVFGGSQFQGAGNDAETGIVTFELSAAYLGRSQMRPSLSAQAQGQLERKLEECAKDDAQALSKGSGS